MEGAAPYYKQTAEQALKTLDSTNSGLSQAEAVARQKRYGPNELTVKAGITPLKILARQFNNALILVLLGAALLIFVIWFFEREQADLVEGGLILAIILFITLLGFFQEYRAEKAMSALRALLALKTKVRRGGRVQVIEAKTLVPGDIVILEEGAKVPADIRLIEASQLSVQEAALTGESSPVNKTIEEVESENLPLAEQRNMVFSGTTIATGRGLGLVVGIGNSTEIGRIAKAVAATPEESTPIQERLARIGKLLSYGVLVVALVVFIFVVFFAQDFATQPLLDRLINSFVAAVALAVAAIPEGLPAVVTIALSLGAQRMFRRRSLVRRLASVETLGSTDVICADKTGTLTKGEMTVSRLYIFDRLIEVTGTGYQTEGIFLAQGKKVQPQSLAPLLRIGALCNNTTSDGKRWLGDPTEIALSVAASKADLKMTGARSVEIPFSSARKMMSVIIREGKDYQLLSKGAPEVILSRCQSILEGSQERQLTTADRAKILKTTQELSTQALRVLACAYRQSKGVDDQAEDGLTFVGLQAMIDPPREEVKELMGKCRASGIRVIMITGDHQSTATAIARAIGIEGETLEGAQLDQLGRNELGEAVRQVNIYARVSPDFKMKIIEALKSQGHIVAMTGDGVNDAPALKRADIGVAMGKSGTDVAKEASDMVLVDDRFASIVAAVEEGRGIYENIRKFVNYLLSCNIAEVLIVFIAIIIFQDLPLTAVMLLWINMVTDGMPAVALGLDRPRRDVMTVPPKVFQEEIVTKRGWLEMVIFGIMLTIGVLWVYFLNLPEGLPEARAAAFSAVVVLELIRIFIVRLDYKAGLFGNKFLLGAVGFSLGLQLVIIYVPAVATLFGVATIDWQDWLLIGFVGVLIWFGAVPIRRALW